MTKLTENQILQIELVIIDRIYSFEKCLDETSFFYIGKDNEYVINLINSLKRSLKIIKEQNEK